MSAAVWALKAVFYTVDRGSAGLVRVEDILAALSDARWPGGTPASGPPYPRRIIGNVGGVPSSETPGPDSDGHAKEDAETLLNHLRGLGVGAECSGGGRDNDDVQGDNGGVVRYIRHLLAPPVKRRRGQQMRRAFVSISCGHCFAQLPGSKRPPIEMVLFRLSRLIEHLAGVNEKEGGFAKSMTPRLTREMYTFIFVYLYTL